MAGPVAAGPRLREVPVEDILRRPLILDALRGDPRLGAGTWPFLSHLYLDWTLATHEPLLDRIQATGGSSWIPEAGRAGVRHGEPWEWSLWNDYVSRRRAAAEFAYRVLSGKEEGFSRFQAWWQVVLDEPGPCGFRALGFHSGVTAPQKLL